MTTKKAVQLQADLQTDEDFSNFMTHKGLLVIEVYCEWCGPCLGMLSTLRRVKLDVGDAVTFAVAKCDTISYINRFFKQSEPIWIFANDGYAVNILFGTDAAKLVRLIYAELKIPPNTLRNLYNISEPLPEEIHRSRVKNEAKETRLSQERREHEQKKFDYFKYVTDTIMENLPEIGVSIIGPHIHRDIFRKAIDFANEKFNIQCKDRRNQPITKEQFEIINTVCKNPLSPNVIDAIDGKDLFIAFWKIPDDGNKRKVHEVLEDFADEASKAHVIPPDEYHDTEEILPPLLTSIKMKVEYELPDDQECPLETESELDPVSEPETPKERKTQQQDDNETNFEEFNSEIGSEEFEEPADDRKQSVVADKMFDDIDMTSLTDASVEEEHIEEVVKKNICTRTVKIPGIWVPKDDRTHAALIYTLFRTQTVSFLPPDPLPEPPHVIMAFNTYKQRDLIDFAERYKDDIPLYGYFTSDDADEAQFIANSKQNYASKPQSASDKLVFKVNKRTSHTMLSLVTYGPTYVSCDTEVGKKEALQFFPENYITAEQELLQQEQEMKVKESKKHKGRRDTESSVKMHREIKTKKTKEHGMEEAPHHEEEGIEAGAVPPEVLEATGVPQDTEIADRPPEGSEIPPDVEKPPEGTDKSEKHEKRESTEKSESPEKQENDVDDVPNLDTEKPAEPSREPEINPAPAVGETPT